MTARSKNKRGATANGWTEARPCASPPCYQHEVDAPPDNPYAMQRWRQEQRMRLLALREGLGTRERCRLSARIIERLCDACPLPVGARLGGYWPLNGEADLRPYLRDHVAKGIRVALPVIIASDRPFEFWRWDARTPLCNRNLSSMPVPVQRTVIQPTVVLVPLPGFDAEGYRLGHGGGYYVRTLATIDPKPLIIGVGYQFARLTTVYPEAHEVPMDAIVTESGVTWHRPRR